MLRLLSNLLLAMVLLSFGTGLELRNAQVQPALAELTSLNALKQEIAAQLKTQTTEINVEYTGNKSELSDKVAEVIKEAIAAEDYVAYIVDSYFYTVRTWGSTARIKLSVDYRETVEQTREVERLVSELLPTIVTPSMSDLDKVKAIHDWVVLNLSYDQSLSRYTAYEALKEKLAVCQGYSLLMYLMLDKSGIENRIIEGEVDTGSHVWNLVRLDNRWYHVDATWDDPTPDQTGEVGYKYFLKNDEQMHKDHTWVKPYPPSN